MGFLLFADLFVPNFCLLPFSSDDEELLELSELLELLELELELLELELELLDESSSPEPAARALLLEEYGRLYR